MLTIAVQFRWADRKLAIAATNAGRDAAHAISAARYLKECLPRAEYWDIPVEQQTEANVPQWVIEFLQKNPAS